MSDDSYSLPNRIVRAEQRIARQREIVAELGKYNSADPARNLLRLMEETLAALHEMQREAQMPRPQPHDAERDAGLSA
jgi:hypothetical protein